MALLINTTRNICLFSTAVWVTAVLIQWACNAQKLQMAARWKSGRLDFGRLCYRNRVRLKCNGVLNYKLSLKYYKSSPLLVPRLQH